ncbi:probable G-protein coupled receptor 25 [Pristis pectinata]|uniref:probable G-protein coupled receptor 25 n=1 Tax=Pristis pectinata TaxID=685728 RepID=UPI00223D2850|nr:probable G-protein coupled receptor 25 [Pristis pectinata]
MSTEEGSFNQSGDYSFFETSAPSYYYVDDINENICLHEELFSPNISISVLYYLIFVTGSLGNIFVILIMAFKEKRRRRLVDTFVINLAIADLIFVFSLPLWASSAGNNHQWTFGNELCKISSYIIAVNRYSSIFFLTCMSIDRYLAIVKMLDFKHIRTQNYAMKISSVVWITSMLLAIPSAYFRRLEQSNVIYCREDSNSRFYTGFNLIAICLTFVLPVVVILFCYCSILNRLRVHYDHSKKTLQRRENSLKIIFAIVSGFILSWLPFNVFKAISLCLKFNNIDLSCWTIVNHGLAIASCLAFINSCMNPIIYALLDRNFRLRTSRLSSCIFGNVRKRRNSFASLSIATESSTFAETTKSNLL